MKKHNYVEELRKAVTDFHDYQQTHTQQRKNLEHHLQNTKGSPFYDSELAKHDDALEVAKAAALQRIASIGAEYSEFLARGFQIDASFLHDDKELLPLMTHGELLSMAKKHVGNTTMQRLIVATCTDKGFSPPPIVPREYRQEGFDLIEKMARAAVNDNAGPTRACFVQDDAWLGWLSDAKRAANVDDFSTHFARYGAAFTLKIPPQFPAE